jgi:hypothetical protein
MAITILQNPAEVSLAQSPIIFSVQESGSILTSSSFQYIGELYYWTGSLFQSASTADYTITKYPNTANAGIFDLNRIINSTLTDLAIQNTSNVTYFAVEFYGRYASGSTFLTGSRFRSNTYKALDGYGVFQEPIGQNITSASVHWPLMTDGPVTQSAFIDNRGLSGVYVGTAGGVMPTRLIYSGSNGSNAIVGLSGSSFSTQQIQSYPIGPAQPGFPISTSGLTQYTIQPFSSSVALGAPIRYEIVCEQKYPNVRVKWKNRYGQFDYINFYMVSRQSFETERKVYQPQLGTWEASTLSYQRYDTAVQNYIVDSKQMISVNSFWLPETYNEILKQLLVSDEIYWIYDEVNDFVRPLTIATQNIVFKTGVVDKLIQYQFDFNFGQPYKLIM